MISYRTKSQLQIAPILPRLWWGATKTSLRRFLAESNLRNGRGHAAGDRDRKGSRYGTGRGGKSVTIAACYLSPEGVVLGADSASTYQTTSGPHHFNYGQKLFEISKSPETGTMALVTWGMGGLAVGSYRTLIAEISDQFIANPPANMQQAAARWIDHFWSAYSTSLQPQIARTQVLDAKPAFDPAKPNDPAHRTAQEENEYWNLRQNFFVGFCIGGYAPPSRKPEAYETLFDPLLGKPSATALPDAQSQWGVPAMITRLIKGCADEVRDAILAARNPNGTPHWTGTPQELDTVIAAHKLIHPSTVPIREAIDFTHATILTTVKAMKFSPEPRVCGGPIEMAVITTDRPFRWVSHKRWDSAVKETE